MGKNFFGRGTRRQGRWCSPFATDNAIEASRSKLGSGVLGQGAIVGGSEKLLRLNGLFQIIGHGGDGGRCELNSKDWTVKWERQ